MLHTADAPPIGGVSEMRDHLTEGPDTVVRQDDWKGRGLDREQASPYTLS